MVDYFFKYTLLPVIRRELQAASIRDCNVTFKPWPSNKQSSLVTK